MSENEITVICCVCNKIIRQAQNQKDISHSYCMQCYQKEMNKIRSLKYA